MGIKRVLLLFILFYSGYQRFWETLGGKSSLFSLSAIFRGCIVPRRGCDRCTRDCEGFEWYVVVKGREDGFTLDRRPPSEGIHHLTIISARQHFVAIVASMP